MPSLAPHIAKSGPEAGRLGDLLTGALMILLGVAIAFSAGFAQPAALHDAAHDARHAAGLPCH